MDFFFLSNTPLFRDIPAEDIEEILRCLGAKNQYFSKGETIYRAGDSITDMGIILSGGVIVENHDVWGNRSILDNIGPGQVFAETYACLPEEPLMVSVVAAKDTQALFLNTLRLFGSCSQGSYTQLIRNLLSVTAQKNLNLSRRIFHTSSKSVRGRLLSYLSFQAVRQGGLRFEIPYNRQQLADYLGVDRSAMSNELSKMRRDGLLTCEKNVFCLNEAHGELFHQSGPHGPERV